LLGICLHASLSFVPGLEAALWPIRDTQTSDTLSVLIFVIHIFRMSVFFLVAGFLAHGLLGRLGTRAFVRNRAARILAPLVLGWLVCFVLIVAVVLWAMARANGGRLPDPLPAAKAGDALNFLHLWFLYLLLWLYALVLGLRVVLHKLDPQGVCAAWFDLVLQTVLRLHVGPLLLALPVCAAFLCVPVALLGMGLPTPGYTLLPPVVALFIYGYLFAIGWLLARNLVVLGILAQRWAANFAIGGVATGVCLWQLAHPTSTSGLPVPMYPQLYAVGYGIALVGGALAFVGAGLRYFAQPSPSIRYLADASYWMYIAHLPLVMALQTAFMLFPWHWALKYLLINLVCVALLLLTYRYGVRSTWLGQLLNGHTIKERTQSLHTGGNQGAK
jgi:glucans biosynthesis protein C